MPADRPATEPRTAEADRLLNTIEQQTNEAIDSGRDVNAPWLLSVVREMRAAAPRAEGLDVERLARAIYAADLVEPVTFSVQTVDSEAERIATEYARLSRPSDERVPESEEPR